MGPQYQVNQIEGVLDSILQKNWERLSPTFKSNYPGKVKILPVTKILRVRIEPASNAKASIIDANTKLVPNVSDFKGTNLSSNNNLVIGAMGVGYATDATTGKEAILKYDKVAPASVRNATFTVYQNGTSIAKYPLSDLMNENIARSIEPNSGKIKLPLAYLIASEEDFDFEIRFPIGASAATGTGNENEYLEFRFFGYETATAK